MVKHKKKNYLVTSISHLCYCSFNCSSKIKKVKLEESSSVKTIYGGAFSVLNIEEIYFPKSLIDLKEEWCAETKRLKEIIISPSNFCQLYIHFHFDT